MATVTVLTDAGEGFIVDKLDPATDGTTLDLGFGAWGTGAGVAAKASTTLSTESSEARTAVTVTQPAADTLRCVYTITASAARTITNAGVLNDDGTPAGTLVLVSSFSGVPLDSGDAIQFTFDLQIL